MKILFLADFRRDSPRFLLNNPRIMSKGFMRHGHDVLEFSYRDMILRNSLIASKKWAVKWAKRKTDQMLLRMAQSYEPDLLFIMTFKLLDVETIRMLKEALPGARVMCWYIDMYDGADPAVAPIAKESEWLLSTGGGAILRTYKDVGVPHCAFMPFPSDPDLEYPREVADKWRSELLFTGKLRHGLRGQDAMREDLVRYLAEHKAMTVWGGLGRPWLEGSDYLNAICGAKIAVSINAFNHIRFYHSDRPVHYMGCGTFTLAKWVPDSDLLFENNRHLCYFSTIEECLELIERYQKDDQQRKKIAAAGMKRTHDGFRGERLAGYIVDLMEKGEYVDDWCEVI